MRRRLLIKEKCVEIPSGYKRCKYLESSGTQKINIAFDETSLMSFSIKIQPNIKYTKAWAALFEVRYVDTSIFPMVKRAYPENIYIPTDSTSNYTIAGVGGMFDDNTILTILYINKHIFINDTLDLEWEKGYEKQIDNVNLSDNAYCKIFECSISSYFTIINLIPCLDMLNRPCMYDTVNEQPFYNSGTGEFGYELLDGTYVAPK